MDFSFAGFENMDLLDLDGTNLELGKQKSTRSLLIYLIWIFPQIFIVVSPLLNSTTTSAFLKET